MAPLPPSALGALAGAVGVGAPLVLLVLTASEPAMPSALGVASAVLGLALGSLGQLLLSLVAVATREAFP